MNYNPCVLFRAKCFSPGPFQLIFGKHYEALWENKNYKTCQGAINFAKRQIEPDPDVWQLAGCKRLNDSHLLLC